MLKLPVNFISRILYSSTPELLHVYLFMIYLTIRLILLKKGSTPAFTLLTQLDGKVQAVDRRTLALMVVLGFRLRSDQKTS